jgi:hypothetical protein
MYCTYVFTVEMKIEKNNLNVSFLLPRSATDRFQCTVPLPPLPFLRKQTERNNLYVLIVSINK